MSVLECPRCGTAWRPRTRAEALQAARLTAIQGVLDEAEVAFSLTLRDMQRHCSGKGNGRVKGVSWVARELRLLGLSLSEIGQLMGGRHHTTVMYLIRRAEDFKSPTSGVQP